MRLTSSSFEPGAAIPTLFTCEGKDVSPEFDWTDTPRETKSFVLILHDPDALRGSLEVAGATYCCILCMNSSPGTDRGK
jgi:phosphatidylethanolamine-binding protein (PEBP) family uncharacterized protein